MGLRSPARESRRPRISAGWGPPPKPPPSGQKENECSCVYVCEHMNIYIYIEREIYSCIINIM